MKLGLISLLGLLASRTHALTSNANVALYWGQNSAGGDDTQKRLADYCDDSTDIVLLSFLYVYYGTGGVPEVNFSNGCKDGTTFSGTGLLQCDNIAEDIKTCQSKGKIVLLSLGGASGSYGFTSADEGTKFADTLWDLFMGGDSDTRPFGDVKIDGFDLDIEAGSDEGYVELITRSRELFATDSSKDYYISAAPQCVIPDQYVNTAITQAGVDFVFVQFYNNYCGMQAWQTGNADPQFNYAAWDTLIKSSKNPSAKIYLGVPASESAAGSGYTSPATVIEAANYLQENYDTFGGVMAWDASQSENFIDKVKSGLSEGGSAESSESSSAVADSSSSSTIVVSSVGSESSSGVPVAVTTAASSTSVLDTTSSSSTLLLSTSADAVSSSVQVVASSVLTSSIVGPLQSSTVLISTSVTPTSTVVEPTTSTLQKSTESENAQTIVTVTEGSNTVFTTTSASDSTVTAFLVNSNSNDDDDAASDEDQEYTEEISGESTTTTQQQSNIIVTTVTDDSTTTTKPIATTTTAGTLKTVFTNTNTDTPSLSSSSEDSSNDDSAVAYVTKVTYVTQITKHYVTVSPSNGDDSVVVYVTETAAPSTVTVFQTAGPVIKQVENLVTTTTTLKASSPQRTSVHTHVSHPSSSTLKRTAAATTLVRSTATASTSPSLVDTTSSIGHTHIGSSTSIHAHVATTTLQASPSYMSTNTSSSVHKRSNLHKHKRDTSAVQVKIDLQRLNQTHFRGDLSLVSTESRVPLPKHWSAELPPYTIDRVNRGSLEKSSSGQYSVSAIASQEKEEAMAIHVHFWGHY